MDPGWFDPIEVIVFTGIRDTVSTVHKAAELLVSEKWPVHGPAYRLALKACILGLEGKQKPEHVRRAFILAAREAGVLRE